MRIPGTLEARLQDPEYRRVYQQEKLILEVTELITLAMQEQGVSRSQLAILLGSTRGYVTQLLSGSRNLTLRTWADMMTSMGYEARVDFQPMAKGSTNSCTWSVTPGSCVEPVTPLRLVDPCHTSSSSLAA